MSESAYTLKKMSKIFVDEIKSFTHKQAIHRKVTSIDKDSFS